MEISFLAHFIILLLIVFFTSFLLIPPWIKRAQKVGLTGVDMQKSQKTPVAEMGGIIVLLAFIIGVMIYVFIRTFYIQLDTQITGILSITTAVLIAGMIGLIDDILGWKIGLKQWQKPLLTLLVAAPIIAVDAGTRIMSLPFLGRVDLGLFYPLLIIPAFILVGTNGFNMLAGYNGLEAGQGILLLGTLAYASFITGSSWLTILSLIMIISLLGFLLYNRFPAKIFPGDTLTYSVGALIASIAIFADMEKVFIVIFIPYIIEFFLKLRGKFKKESFAQPQEDNSLTLKYPSIYGLEHLTIKIMQHLHIKPTERKVVGMIHLFQLGCIVLAFII